MATMDRRLPELPTLEGGAPVLWGLSLSCYDAGGRVGQWQVWRRGAGHYLARVPDRTEDTGPRYFPARAWDLAEDAAGWGTFDGVGWVVAVESLGFMLGRTAPDRVGPGRVLVVTAEPGLSDADAGAFILGLRRAERQGVREDYRQSIWCAWLRRLLVHRLEGFTAYAWRGAEDGPGCCFASARGPWWLRQAEDDRERARAAQAG